MAMSKFANDITIITIEGNIGSGKSTFVQNLNNYYKYTEVFILPEPVDEWLKIKDDEGNILEHYYKEQKKYAFSFQMMAYISRLAILKKAIEDGYKYIITERCLETDKHVFCQMLYDDKFISCIEFQIYNKWFDTFQIKANYQTIYMRCDPQVAYDRVLKRGRKEESIPLEYLQKCHDYHEKWLKNALCIDANTNIYENPGIINKWIDQIKLFIEI